MTSVMSYQASTKTLLRVVTSVMSYQTTTKTPLHDVTSVMSYQTPTKTPLHVVTWTFQIRSFRGGCSSRIGPFSANERRSSLIRTDKGNPTFSIDRCKGFYLTISSTKPLPRRSVLTFRLIVARPSIGKSWDTRLALCEHSRWRRVQRLYPAALNDATGQRNRKCILRSQNEREAVHRSSRTKNVG
jgi:hypothetical protein